jgi:hypothetical protein
MWMRRCWFLGATALVLAGCLGSGAQFAGKRQPARVSAGEVQLGERAPEGLQQLGDASAECSPLAPDAEIDDVRYSDLSCSQALLGLALREVAADAGGSFLTTPQCEEKHSGERVSWVGCEAEVWAPTTAAPPGPIRAAAPAFSRADATAAGVGAPHLGSVHEAWRISLDFWAAPGVSRPRAHDAASVREVDTARVGERRLGDLTASCDEGCTVHGLREGLRAAAARLGAATLVGVRCIEQEAARRCVASISAPEREEPGWLGTR